MFSCNSYAMNIQQLKVVKKAIIFSLDILDSDKEDVYRELVTLKGLCNAGVECCENLAREDIREIIYDMPITDILFETLTIHKERLDDDLEDNLTLPYVEELLTISVLIAHLDK